jgi:putative membrane protein
MTDPVAKKVVQTHEKIRQSANVIEASTLEQSDSADRRTELAADRTVLAAERTYAAWVRTGLAALASGIGARALLAKIVPDWMTMATGGLLIVFSAFCFLAAIWRELLPAISSPRPEVQRLPAAMLIVVNGFLVLVSVAALIGVLTSR